MAETDRLKLALPGENDYVDINTLNQNFNKIDSGVFLALAAAAEYSPEQTYALGSYCIRGGKLHRCTTAISTAEEWTAAHWTETTIGAELSGKASLDEKGKVLESQLPSMDYVPNKEKGAVDGVATLDENGKVPSDQLPEISSVKTYTATIGTTWTEDEDTGVKFQSVAISGVLAKHTAKVDHAYTGSGTSDDYAAFVEAENQYLTCITNGYAATYNGGIKFYIFGDAPTVSIPIVVEVS